MPSLSKNKKAYFDYEVLETFEAGIELLGSEVKSIKKGQANLKGSFVSFKNNELFTENLHVSKYKYSTQELNPLRKRRLLLKSKEIDKIIAELNSKGIAVIPLELYTKRALIKIKIGICRGKKKYDKREDLKKKAQQKEIKQALKRFTHR